jgi:hypothetical protein
MKEIINSFIDSAKERLKNPILASFFISWFVFNWKAIFYITQSKNSIENKIIFIDKNYVNVNNNFWYPLLFSVFYILVIPYILWVFDQISARAIIGRKSSALRLNISDIKNKQKIAIEESELENIRASFRDKADLNKKIEILTSQIIDKDEIIDSLNDSLKVVKDENFKVKEFLNENDENIINENENSFYSNLYKEFKESDLFDFFKEIGSEISRRNGLPNKIDDLVVEKYKHSGIIVEHRDDENQKIYYKLTKKGQSFWGIYLSNIKVSKKEKANEIIEDLPF